MRMMSRGVFFVLLANVELVIANFFRYLVFGEGIALLLISMYSTYEIVRRSWPLKFKIGMILRWSGRTILVIFGCVFVSRRLNHPEVNWYSPVLSLSFSFLVAGSWLTRTEPEETQPDSDSLYHDTKGSL